MTSLAKQHDRQLLEQLSDGEIAARVRAGEVALFELIMRRYNRRLFRIARGILSNDAEAEDAVQEAYVDAYSKLHQFRGPNGFPSWLCQIVTNEALMRRRKRACATLTQLNTQDDLPNPEVTMADPQSPEYNPEAALHAQQLQQLLELAIDGLPDLYRTVFVLREVEQMSVTDTAQCLGIEENAVKTRVHRARRMLQHSLTSDLSTALTGVFNFDGARCDRIVARVIARINQAAAS